MHRPRVLSLIATMALGVPRLGAQAVQWEPLITIGGDSDERARIAQLRGLTRTDGYLLRSASALLAPLPGDSARLRWILVLPEYAAVYNSALPFSLNDGAMWAGRGWNQDLRVGLHAEWKRVSLTLAPEILISENLSYDLPPPTRRLLLSPGRDSLSSPWHTGPSSIDLPLRFGLRGYLHGDPGQSTLSVDWGAVSTGVTTENEWWGPGIRNALVLSNNAPGIPRLFLRTSRPVRTGAGSFEARWFVGGLSESSYFDQDPTNNLRSISAIAVTWVPLGQPDLTLGFARTVYAPVDGWARVPWRLFDVFRDRGWQQRTGDTTATPSRDQLFSLFGRWVFPADGLALHFEWGRSEPPTSLRDFLAAPNHSQGYTLGLEWATAVRGGPGALRVQAEVTNLQQSSTYRDRPVDTWYTGRAAPQGYTQQGQVIGAAIGPGASSQWLGIDYVAPTWRVGLFGGRIRWDDDALYALPRIYANNTWCSHDVSLFGGVTAAYASRWGRLHALLTRGERLNVFFSHVTWCGPMGNPFDILDARTTTLQLRFTPRAP